MSLDLETLKTRLLAFDGRGLSVLGEIEATCMHEGGYCDFLIELAGDPEGSVSSGATWLIKARVERGEALSRAQTMILFSWLASVQDWTAQLHICQSVGHLTVEPADAARLASWLTPLLTHKRPFLRAWSLDALCQIARDNSDYAEEARTALAAAAGDTAASVRARARNIQL